MEAPETSDLRGDFIMLQGAWIHRTVIIFCDFGIGEHRDHPISIGRTTMDSSRVHDGGAQHRTVDRNPHQEDRKADLLTRGLKWCVRSSLNSQSRSTMRSPSDGSESPRSPLTVATRGTIWSDGSPSDGNGYAGPTIVARSRGDRG